MENYNQESINALSKFVRQYPASTSDDYQTFILGFKACWDVLIAEKEHTNEHEKPKDNQPSNNWY